MPDKRRDERKPARIRARFWRPGEPAHAQQGYTTNISGSGAFIQTDHPHPKGLRLQVEFSTDRNGFVCEALVARAIKVAPELQSARRGGMGLRFLSVKELLAGFLPQSASDSETEVDLDGDASGENPPDADAQQTNEQTPEVLETAKPAPSARERGEIEVTTRGAASRHPAAAPPREETTPKPSASSGAGAESGPTPDTEPLRFRLSPPSLDIVRALFERQIEPGILNLPSRTDCQIGRPVVIEFKTPPGPLGQRILTFEGEVLECGQANPGDASSLRVRIRENSAARDFLRRILETGTPST